MILYILYAKIQLALVFYAVTPASLLSPLFYIFKGKVSSSRHVKRRTNGTNTTSPWCDGGVTAWWRSARGGDKRNSKTSLSPINSCHHPQQGDSSLIDSLNVQINGFTRQVSKCPPPTKKIKTKPKTWYTSLPATKSMISMESHATFMCMS